MVNYWTWQFKVCHCKCLRTQERMRNQVKISGTPWNESETTLWSEPLLSYF